jgi:hypothetical protein
MRRASSWRHRERSPPADPPVPCWDSRIAAQAEARCSLWVFDTGQEALFDASAMRRGRGDGNARPRDNSAEGVPVWNPSHAADHSSYWSVGQTNRRCGLASASPARIMSKIRSGDLAKMSATAFAAAVRCSRLWGERSGRRLLPPGLLSVCPQRLGRRGSQPEYGQHRQTRQTSHAHLHESGGARAVRNSA